MHRVSISPLLPLVIFWFFFDSSHSTSVRWYLLRVLFFHFLIMTDIEHTLVDYLYNIPGEMFIQVCSVFNCFCCWVAEFLFWVIVTCRACFALLLSPFTVDCVSCRVVCKLLMVPFIFLYYTRLEVSHMIASKTRSQEATVYFLLRYT